MAEQADPRVVHHLQSIANSLRGIQQDLSWFRQREQAKVDQIGRMAAEVQNELAAARRAVPSTGE